MKTTSKKGALHQAFDTAKSVLRLEFLPSVVDELDLRQGFVALKNGAKAMIMPSATIVNRQESDPGRTGLRLAFTPLVIHNLDTRLGQAFRLYDYHSENKQRDKSTFAFYCAHGMFPEPECFSH